MAKVLGEYNCWEGDVRIGAQGRAAFHILRDGDAKQVIYPAVPKATMSSIPVRGPDQLHKGKHFIAQGRPGDLCKVHVEVVDGRITVTVKGDSHRVVWKNQLGWGRRDFTVVGEDQAPIVMTMDPRQPGLFSCQVTVGSYLYDDSMADAFQVAVDGDLQQAFYPDAVESENPGQHIVWPPNGSGSSNKFVIRRADVNMTYDILLDLNAEDRRKTVTWALTDLPGLEDAR